MEYNKEILTQLLMLVMNNDQPPYWIVKKLMIN